jgi:regulatory protein
MGPTREELLTEAFRYLGPRERTTAEVRKYLARTYAPASVIDDAIEQLSDRGYLDDVRYARCFAEDRRNLDNWGSGRICRRLLELGISAELAQEASQPEDPEQELQQAVELLRRRIRAICADDPRSRKRAMDMLVRRGYAWDLAYSAVRQFEQQAV